jgi:hypothetical protein
MMDLSPAERIKLISAIEAVIAKARIAGEPETIEICERILEKLYRSR